MKIAIGSKIHKGPYGGGNKFAALLDAFLIRNGVHVVNYLDDRDIDIILVTDPRFNSQARSFGVPEVLNYIREVNPEAMIVHRVNECDERKNTKTVNKQLASANFFADHTIYIGTWLVDLFKDQQYKFTENNSVILNGGNREVFTYKAKRSPKHGRKRIVTHHWSSHWMKGWDIYHLLDDLLATEKYKNHLEFHYIGNAPKDNAAKNTHFYSPASDSALSNLLHGNHIYLTASLNEPAGMHHVEACLCGLPVLYRNSGALPEYCNGYGVMFNGPDDFEVALDKMVANYDNYVDRMAGYPNDTERMCGRYFDVFTDLVNRREEILKKRGNRFNRLAINKYKITSFFYGMLNKARIT